jgi:hypothetical protein
MTNLPRDPLISLEVQASSIIPLLHSPKLSPSILRRGGKLSTNGESTSPNLSNRTDSATFSVTLLSSEPWLPLSASLSSLTAESRNKILEELGERAHSTIFLGPTNHDGCFTNAGPSENGSSTLADEPLLETTLAPFAVLYCMWKPGVPLADMYSQIVTSWSRLQIVKQEQCNSVMSTTSDHGPNPPAFNANTLRTMAVNDGKTCDSTTRVGSFEPPLVDESGESKHEEENAILEVDCRRSERHDTLCKVYLVIDQVLGYGISRGDAGMDCEAKVLAKALATTPEIRSLCQGISICVSCAKSPSTYSAADELLAVSSPENVTTPASPGLELVRQALLLGENQRQLHAEQEGRTNHSASSSKGLISVIATEKSVLDARRSMEIACVAEETDSSAFVDEDAVSMSPPSQTSPHCSTAHHAHLQHPVTVVAEWNGQGNLFAFAQRAHAAWRLSVGWPPEPKPRPPPRKTPRRIRRLRPLVASPPPTPVHVFPTKQDNLMNAYAETSKLRRQEDFRQDAVAALVIMCYLWFHFAEDCSTIIWLLLAPSGHAEMAQYLREWR